MDRKSIFGNWSNQHCARFNANLGIVVCCSMAMFFDVVFAAIPYGAFGDFAFLVFLLLCSALQLPFAYYYHNHPEKWIDIEEK